MRVSIVIPTRDRPEILARTLGKIGRLALDPELVEVIVIDNGSSVEPRVPQRLQNLVRVRSRILPLNRAIGARNMGVAMSRAEWILMLDDDSWPEDEGFLEVLEGASEDVGAIGASIRLLDGSRERGGLPEVVVGCGVLYRRDAFFRRWYDSSYEYYVEEYDLCAKMIRDGYRVVHDGRFRVTHAKVTEGRDFNGIVRRLVRNNAWMLIRHSPREELRGRLWETITRYGVIAHKEDAIQGYGLGLCELAVSWWKQDRERALTGEQWDRFTGLAHAREAFGRDETIGAGMRAAIVARGKHDWVVERALRELDVEIVGEDQADVLVVGTMSPGVMLDARDALADERRPVVVPWEFPHASGTSGEDSSTIAA